MSLTRPIGDRLGSRQYRVEGGVPGTTHPYFTNIDYAVSTCSDGWTRASRRIHGHRVGEKWATKPFLLSKIGHYYPHEGQKSPSTKYMSCKLATTDGPAIPSMSRMGCFFWVKNICV